MPATFAARKGADPGSTRTAKPLTYGPEKCAQTFSEKAVEVITETAKRDRAKLTLVAADVHSHPLVMLTARDVTLTDFDRREEVSGLAKWQRGGRALFVAMGGMWTKRPLMRDHPFRVPQMTHAERGPHGESHAHPPTDAARAPDADPP